METTPDTAWVTNNVGYIAKSYNYIAKRPKVKPNIAIQLLLITSAILIDQYLSQPL